MVSLFLFVGISVSLLFTIKMDKIFKNRYGCTVLLQKEFIYIVYK